MSLLVPVLVASCSNLAVIEEDICGNRVIEVGEDCDTVALLADATCGDANHPTGACTYICQGFDEKKNIEEILCPDGWNCGRDNRCRLHAGSFENAIRVADFEFSSLRISDMNGDAYSDVFGTNENRIAVLFGESDGHFEDLSEMSMPRPISALDYGDFDLDGKTDVLVPVRHGIHMFLGTAARQLQPIIYQPLVIKDVSKLVVLPLESDPNSVGTEVLLLSGPQMRFQELQGSTGLNGVRFPLNKSAEQLIGSIPVSDLGIGNGRSEFAISLEGASRIWVFTSTGTFEEDTLKVVLHSEIELPHGTQVNEGVFFADMNGDGFDDLFTTVISLATDVTSFVVAYWSPQTDQFASSCIVEFPEIAEDNERVSFPLAMADLNSDLRADFIFNYGIRLNPLVTSSPVCGPLTEKSKLVFVSDPDEWNEAAVGDFNRDGLPDVVVAKAYADEIRVLLGDGTGVFNPIDIPTQDLARLLRVGDFDGDHIDDIALVTPLENEGDVRLWVSFGSSTHQPTQLEEMGVFENIQDVSTLMASSGSPNFDRTMDLIVTSSITGSTGSNNSYAMALMYGGFERRLLSPFLLKADLADSMLRGLDSTQAALLGNFCNYCPDDPIETCLHGPDLAAIAWESSPQDGASAPSRPGSNRAPAVLLWVLSGHLAPEGAHLLDFSEGAFQRTRIETPSPFDFRSACWTHGDLDLDQIEEFIAVDHAHSCVDPLASPRGNKPSRLMIMEASTSNLSCNGELTITVTELPSSFFNPSAVISVDADQDGDQDILVGFRGLEQGNTVNGAGTVLMWNEAGRFHSNSSTALPLSHPVMDLAEVDLGPGVAPGILVLNQPPEEEASDGRPEEYGLFLYQLDEATVTYLPPVRLDETRLGFRLDVGDLNGNGLEDIAWTDGESLRVLFAVEAQEKR